MIAKSVLYQTFILVVLGFGFGLFSFSINDLVIAK